ncbi:MAG: flagellar biosynthesis anti-sigma factor FlgM [Candidatus Krumholzibacteria bacterium]|nr:flagellar biosynthesis anti-sigma factor FlgM [Candidatus Krumholzibacteria bacterium]
MVMDKINGFTNLGKGLLERFQGSGRTDYKTDEQRLKINTTGSDRGSVRGDTAEISPKAHRLIALRHAIDSGHKALEELPEVRQDRMDQVRARLSKGYYNSVEVRTLVIERLEEVARKMEDL